MVLSRVDVDSLDIIDFSNLRDISKHKSEMPKISEVLNNNSVKWDISMYIGIDKNDDVVYLDIFDGYMILPVDNYCESPMSSSEFFFTDPETYKVSVVNQYIAISDFKYILKAKGRLQPYCVQTFHQEPDWYSKVTKAVADEYLKDYRITEDINGEVIEGKYIKNMDESAISMLVQNQDLLS